MTPLQQTIVEDAVTWVGTPFRANAKLKGVGADCVGVIMGAFETAGLYLAYRNDYSQRPDGSLRGEILQRGFVLVKNATLTECDLLLMAFRPGTDPHHVALYIGNNEIVHAYAQARKCVRTTYDAYWSGATRGVYRLPGLTA